MDFGIGSVTAITAICYLGGMACKATTKVKDEVIPVVCGVTGGILGGWPVCTLCRSFQQRM